ncbi:MAG TPA: phenylacetate--CoA ligase [Thermodesulfobacteriota bacterium]|nr:phenylacetate--CoA ligase [Thermodesulfobacteriota bacterium]
MADPFWEREIETLKPKELRRLQLRRLKKTLRQAATSPFYSGLFKKHQVSAEKVESLEDLKEIPFTTKQDLRDQFPYGLLTVPREKIVRLHSSSGTTGRATAVFHTQKDLDGWANLVARCMYMAGVRKQDVFQNMSGYGLFTGGLGFQYGAERLGALTIPSGSGNSKRQIHLMQDFGTTVVHIIPSYALHLWKVFGEMGLEPKRDTQLRILLIGAEPHSEATRQRIEEMYGVDAFNSYGLSEMNGPGVAFECPQKKGMHFWEDAFLVEVIDPKTGEVLPDGVEGELVYTTLNREAMPMIRYRSKDLATIFPELCPCGRTHRRMSRIKGRSDDMFILKGVNIFPLQIDTTLMNIPEVGTNYLIVLERENFEDRMIVRVEVRPQFFKGDLWQLEKLRKQITEALKSELLVTPKVELVEPDSLPKSEGKAVRVMDKREM